MKGGDKMTFTNVRTNEPAFISNEKYAKLKRPRGLHKNLTDCCYSLANLALIVGCIIALVFLAKFFYDQTLYEFSEHLLGSRFYRQLIFIMISLAFVLLIPLYNTANACFLGEASRTSLGAKLFYQLLMVALMFVGLALIAQSLRQASVEAQLAPELRRHMKFRYENDFSYVLVDSVQEEYQCCDELWYRANYFDKLPLTCYRKGAGVAPFALSWTQDCALVLGGLVSGRSQVITCCLVAVLVGLAILCGLDALECALLTGSRAGKSSSVYDVRAREEAQQAGATCSRALNESSLSSDDDDDAEENEHEVDDRRAGAARGRPRLLGETSGNLRDSQETRLLKPRSGEPPNGQSKATAALSKATQAKHAAHSSGVGASTQPAGIYRDPYNSMGAQSAVYQPTTEPILLTRAHYVPAIARAQSPIFLGSSSYARKSLAGSPVPAGSSPGSSPIRRIDGVSSDQDEDQLDCDSSGDEQRNRSTFFETNSSQTLERTSSSSQTAAHYDRAPPRKVSSSLERDTQTRRSALSVRFAD